MIHILFFSGIILHTMQYFHHNLIIYPQYSFRKCFCAGCDRLAAIQYCFDCTVLKILTPHIMNSELKKLAAAAGAAERT